jgi:toxin ParE1/3/4
VRHKRWTIRLSDAAEADYDEIVRRTAQRFGVAQSATYGRLLAAALARLERGPSVVGARQRNEIGAGLRTLHIGGRGRHIALFRVGSAQERMIDVLRVLHDAMDLARHVPLE